MLSRLTFDTLVSANEKTNNSSLRISIINLRNIFLQKHNVKGRRISENCETIQLLQKE